MSMGCEAMASIKQEEENSKRTAVATRPLHAHPSISPGRGASLHLRGTARQCLRLTQSHLLSGALRPRPQQSASKKTSQNQQISMGCEAMASIKQEEENSKRTAVATRPLHAYPSISPGRGASLHLRGTARQCLRLTQSHLLSGALRPRPQQSASKNTRGVPRKSSDIIQ